MDKMEELRLMFASFVDFVIVEGNDETTTQNERFGVFRVISTSTLISNLNRYDEVTGKQYSFRSKTALIQMDFYAPNKLKAEIMANDLLNKITYIKKNEFLRANFGLQDIYIDVVDRTLIENTQYIYRYGFDININYSEMIERVPEPNIKSIDFDIKRK